ncbi:MAG: molybdopterin molybdenumtransferase MoeA, partial [Elusimicrobia bacterium]|nr:molybdopterin molybdenumtransferase MoeA [Elusimicrobiota bacterium]
MLDPRQALKKILDNVRILSAERAALADACGRALSRDLAARLDLPPFHNSAMDGYAVRARDCRRASPKSPAIVRLKGAVAAGASPRMKVMPGEAAKIMTGAILPEGADAVVRKEWTQEAPGGW